MFDFMLTLTDTSTKSYVNVNIFFFVTYKLQDIN